MLLTINLHSKNMESTARVAPRGPATPAPFWNRIPRFFLFPLHPPILGRIGLFGLIPALGVYATSVNAILVAVAGLSLLAWIFFLRYGSRVLNETSQGRLSPAEYDDADDPTLSMLPYSMFGLCVASSFGVGLVTGIFGEGAGIAANFLAMLMLPASFMVLVHTRSLFAGLNPANAWALVGAVGKPYLLLCLFLFCLSSAQMFMSFWLFARGVVPLLEKWAELQAVLSQVRSQDDFEQAVPLLEAFDAFLGRQRPRLFVSVFGFTAVAMYFTMIAFNMMGYVLYQYHRALGLEVDDPRAGNGEAHDPVADQVAGLIAAGQLDKAIDIAYEAQRTDPENLVSQERYHKLLHLAGRTDRLLPHAQRFIAQLLRRQMPGKALDVLRRCREKAAEFRPEDPATILALAQAARSGRDAKFAMEIIRSFDRVFPQHPLIPDVYSLGARILCEDLRQDAKADRLFAAICEHYPDHPCAVQAREYRAVLARLQPQANAG